MAAARALSEALGDLSNAVARGTAPAGHEGDTDTLAAHLSIEAANYHALAEAITPNAVAASWYSLDTSFHTLARQVENVTRPAFNALNTATTRLVGRAHALTRNARALGGCPMCAGDTEPCQTTRHRVVVALDYGDIGGPSYIDTGCPAHAAGMAVAFDPRIVDVTFHGTPDAINATAAHLRELNRERREEETFADDVDGICGHLRDRCDACGSCRTCTGCHCGEGTDW